MNNLLLGTKVQIRAHLVPRKVINLEKRHTRREWHRVLTSKAGIVVGVRSVKEGQARWDDNGRFEPERHIKVYLVAVSLNQIIKVLPEDLVVCEEPSNIEADKPVCYDIPGQQELFVGAN
ncbi:MAG: hypothetical protein H0Z39_10860 [Peptococcaceae bacterium]|nr:hypothetical protein [Peptococcaceae bacterium]